jgi:hypothetical protein
MKIIINNPPETYFSQSPTGCNLNIWIAILVWYNQDKKDLTTDTCPTFINAKHPFG